MEFKVIFIGFALHCVLNTVLICKTVIMKKQAQKTELAIVADEKVMFQSIEELPGDFDLVQLDSQASFGREIVAE